MIFLQMFSQPFSTDIKLISEAILLLSNKSVSGGRFSFSWKCSCHYQSWSSNLVILNRIILIFNRGIVVWVWWSTLSCDVIHGFESTFPHALLVEPNLLCSVLCLAWIFFLHLFVSSLILFCCLPLLLLSCCFRYYFLTLSSLEYCLS